MGTVTISPKYQIVIPEEIPRKTEAFTGSESPGHCTRSRIELIPVRPLKAMRGFLKGIETSLIGRMTEHEPGNAGFRPARGVPYCVKLHAPARGQRSQVGRRPKCNHKLKLEL